MAIEKELAEKNRDLVRRMSLTYAENLIEEYATHGTSLGVTLKKEVREGANAKEVLLSISAVVLNKILNM